MNKKLLLLSLSCNLLPCLVSAQHSRISINSESGYSIQWNGNNGNHFNPETGAESPENDAFNAYSFASSNYFPDTAKALPMDLDWRTSLYRVGKRKSNAGKINHPSYNEL